MPQTMADTKRVPGPTYYAPKVGLADKKDVYSKTNMRSSVHHSFGKAELPWQKKVKPTQGLIGRVRDTTERQVSNDTSFQIKQLRLHLAVRHASPAP